VRAELTDLGGGVVRVTLPLPWALDHVHCYALASPDEAREMLALKGADAVRF